MSLLARAGRLTDGPYTSYDLNTLLKATAGERCAVVVSQGIVLITLPYEVSFQNSCGFSVTLICA